MKNNWGAFSWILGQAVSTVVCYGLVERHGFSVAMATWMGITILLDIRFKMQG